MTSTRKIGPGASSFYAFLVAQFLGAANDNAFKITIVMFVLATVADEASQVFYSSLATAILPLPFLLFSPLAGYLADRFPKHRVLFATKVPEVVAMALGAVAFYMQSLPFLLGVFFLMATQSAFFSPAKYGILPEVFEDQHLSAANGLLELATNLAILTGSVAGVFIYGWFSEDLTGAGLAYLAVAIAGTIAVLFVPRAPAGNPAARPAWNLLSSAADDWLEVRRSPVLFYTVLGIAWFSFLGSVFLTILPVFGKNTLGLSEQKSAILLALLSVGIAGGSVLAARLSRGHVELGLVPLGSVGLAAFAIDLALFGGTAEFRIGGIPLRAIVDLAAIGVGGGLFIIPLNALLQLRSPEGMKGRLIAFSNVLSFTAVLAAAGLPWLLTTFGLSTGHVILFVSVLTVVGTVYVMNLLPDFFVRLVLWILTNTIYRVRVLGAENVPREGALFVANHVSWVDFLLIGAATDRMIRFLMYRGYYEWRALNWFFRRMHTIPVAGGDPPSKTEESLAVARREIHAGHAVCIFAEGAITRTGNLLRFRRGLEKIASGVGCPIVPIFLDGVWGSLFSFEGGRFFLKRPKRFRARVTVVFGKPLPSTATALDVRRSIQDLSAEAFRDRGTRQKPLGVEWLATARRNWRRRFLADSSGRTIRFGEALVESLALRDAIFGPERDGAEPVGILLRPGIPAALANFAVSLAGKAAVNLPESVSTDMLGFQIRTTGIRRVLTDPTFAARVGETGIAGLGLVDVEEALVRAKALRLSGVERFLVGVLPLRSAARRARIAEGDIGQTAAIVFSYPPDRAERPLGAALSHHNVLSNLEALRQVFHIERDDAVLGILPFSNALGLAATLWLPAIAGFRAAYGSGASDPEVGELCARNAVTIVPAGPDELAALVSSVAPEELRRLRFVAVGGGRISDEAREAFTERFGIAPVDGYGCPECAPVVSLNVPDVEHGRSKQVGTRAGTSGHPLPGVSVRIVENGSELPPDAEGLLEIRGPNVFSGYVNDAERTHMVLVDGWFRTGERASLGEDGFLTVRPR